MELVTLCMLINLSVKKGCFNDNMSSSQSLCRRAGSAYKGVSTELDFPTVMLLLVEDRRDATQCNEEALRSSSWHFTNIHSSLREVAVFSE